MVHDAISLNLHSLESGKKNCLYADPTCTMEEIEKNIRELFNVSPSDTLSIMHEGKLINAQSLKKENVGSIIGSKNGAKNLMISANRPSNKQDEEFVQPPPADFDTRNENRAMAFIEGIKNKNQKLKLRRRDELSHRYVF